MHKIWQRAAVIEAHTRTISIEDAHDAGIHTMISMISHSHGFRKSLGFIINAARADRIHVAPILLMLRRNFRVPITFARRGQEKLCSLGKREPESVVCAERTNFKSLDGELEVIHWTGW